MTTHKKSLIKKRPIRNSAKLFIIEITDNTFTILTGKSGSILKQTTQTHDSNETATKIAYDLIYKKLRRGYHSY